MNNLVSEWDKHFVFAGLRDEFLGVYKEYYTPLLNNNLPPIFGFMHLHQLLGVNAFTLAK